MAGGVLFDLDETLLDRRTTLQVYASDLYGDFEFDAKICEADFVLLVEQLDGRGRAPRDEFFSRIASEAFGAIRADELEDHFYSRAWLNPQPFEGVIESLRELRRRDLQVGIVTNGRRDSQESKIKNSGLVDLVDAFVISGSLGIRKPDERIFGHICRELGIDAAASWHIGDDPVADIEGASKLGFSTVWLERYLPWPEELDRCYDVKAEHVSDVLAILPQAP